MAVLFCDAHNVLEVGGELNGAVVALLNKAMAAGVYVVVLSWVGWTSLAKVAQDIAHMAAGLGSGTCSGSGSGSGSDSGSGGLRLDHRVPIVTCTGNRVAKMALVGMVADVLEQPVALLDDSDRNLEAAFSTSNMAAVAEGFGVMPSITGLYMLYVKKGTRAEGGVVSGRQYKRRVRKTVESALAVADRCEAEEAGGAAYVLAHTVIVADSARVIPRHGLPDSPVVVPLKLRQLLKAMDGAQ